MHAKELRVIYRVFGKFPESKTLLQLHFNTGTASGLCEEVETTMW